MDLGTSRASGTAPRADPDRDRDRDLRGRPGGARQGASRGDRALSAAPAALVATIGLRRAVQRALGRAGASMTRRRGLPLLAHGRRRRLRGLLQADLRARRVRDHLDVARLDRGAGRRRRRVLRPRAGLDRRPLLHGVGGQSPDGVSVARAGEPDLVRADRATAAAIGARARRRSSTSSTAGSRRR